MASWKLESSATSHSPGARRQTSPIAMVPMLPTASAAQPPARSRSRVRVVVVVLPLVPVMPTQRSGLSRQASSGSPMTSVAWAAALAKKSLNSEMPGLTTATS